MTNIASIQFIESHVVLTEYTSGGYDMKQVVHPSDIDLYDPCDTITRQAYDEMLERYQAAAGRGEFQSFLDFTGVGDDVVMSEVFIATGFTGLAVAA